MPYTPPDGTYTCTQTEPLPVVQFTITVENGILTNDLNGQKFEWREDLDKWKVDGEEEVAHFHAAVPPDLPFNAWNIMTLWPPPAKACKGTWE